MPEGVGAVRKVMTADSWRVLDHNNSRGYESDELRDCKRGRCPKIGRLIFVQDKGEVALQDAAPRKTLVSSADKEKKVRWHALEGKEQVSRKKNETKDDMFVKRSVRINRKTYERISGLLEDANIDSVTEFIERSLEFYSGYIQSGRSKDYLIRTIASLMDAKLESNDDHTRRIMFKLAVEIAMQNRILAKTIKISDKEIDEIREKALDDVRRIWP